MIRKVFILLILASISGLAYFLYEPIKELYVSLPENTKPAVLAATSTLIGGFLGAATAQYISHRLTFKREKKKYDLEVYQNLYIPIIFDIYSFIDISTHFRRGHDVIPEANEEELFNKILKHLGRNLKYASPKVTYAYHKAKVHSYQIDHSGIFDKVDEINLIIVFLGELVKLDTMADFCDDQTYNQVMKYLSYYRIWLLLIYFTMDVRYATEIMRMKFYFVNSKLTDNSYRKLLFYRKINPGNISMENSTTFLKKIYTKVFFSGERNFLFYTFDILCGDKLDESMKETLIKLKDVSENRLYGQRLPVGLSVHVTNVTHQNGRLMLEIEYFNYKGPIFQLDISQFVLRNFGSRTFSKITVSELRSGFWNSYWYSEKKHTLLPGESTKLRLYFYVPENENIEYYKICWVYNDDVFPISPVLLD